MDLPVTDVEVARNMAAGLQLLKVVELKDWKDKDGNTLDSVYRKQLD